MKDTISNYYTEIADKYFSSSCSDEGYNNILQLSMNLFNKDTLDCIAYCYVINYGVFLYNYEKVNNSEETKYISLDDNNLYSTISICKQQVDDNYKVSEWNKLGFYKTIKNIIYKYCDLLFKSDDVISFDNKDEYISFMINTYNNKEVSIVSKDKIYPYFKDIVGLEEAKYQVKEKVFNPIIYKDIYSKYDVQVGGGILLYGLPGTGKTMFAQAVANEIDGYFIAIKSSDLKSKYYGDTEQKVKDLFDEARKHEVSVIFFDEFEAIGVSRDKFGTEITGETIVPELLAQMQGFDRNENTILVIAATNRPWDIDSALLRPGRFDSLIYIDLPNEDLRKQMFVNNLSTINYEDDVIDFLSSSTYNYNGADIKRICDSLIRIVIAKEINNVNSYKINVEDCKEVLNLINTSVSIRDVIQMEEFRKNNK